jgi:hypothetical protein
MNKKLIISGCLTLSPFLVLVACSVYYDPHTMAIMLGICIWATFLGWFIWEVMKLDGN